MWFHYWRKDISPEINALGEPVEKPSRVWVILDWITESAFFIIWIFAILFAALS